MKRPVIGLLLTFIVAPACSCGGGTTLPPEGTPDAAVALPDAMVIVPADAGMHVDLPVPTINTVSPSSGTEAGGTRVTIRGTSFTEPAQVWFGDLQANPDTVVVLDEVSIAATTPAHAPGAVTVKVTTEGGTAELPDGFRYHRELLILDVTPARIPDAGGVPIMIIGKGFDADTLIFFDRKPLAGATLVDAEHIQGYAPALDPGRPEVRALHREADTRRSDLLFVYGTPDILAVAPGYGPTTGGTLQTLAGDGFEDAQQVTIGGIGANDLTIASGASLSVRAPVLPAGVHSIRVDNADTFGEVQGAYVAFDPADNIFGLVGVVPSHVSSAGGDMITVVGNGFPPDVTLTVGGVSAMITDIRRPNVILAIVPAGLSAGAADVVATSAVLARSVTLTDGVTVFDPIEVNAIDPNSGPTSGGTNVTITGKGFQAGADVRIGDIPLANVVIVSGNEITGTTVAGAHGAQDVVVKSSDTRGVLPGGFRFEEEFALIRIDPNEGSIAGNTYVSIFGRGLDGPVAVKFGANDGLVPQLENGSIIGVRTAPASTGTVDVEVTTANGNMTFPSAFTFYDPRLITGGAWGGAIEGAVNVAVLDINSGNPMPGIIVQLGYDADPRYANVTDANGLTTISSPEIRGAQTITSGQNGVEFVTFMELNARNLTVFATQYVAPTSPCPPPPMGVVPPQVRGHLFKFKTSLDPVTHPGWIPVARVTYSSATVFNPNGPDPMGLNPSQVAQVTMDGGEYAISVLRLGTVAVYAILYDYNPDTQETIPRKMGIARQVPAAIDTITEPIDISLDIELTKQLTITMDNPPDQVPGPSINAVFPFLNLESDGVIPFTATAVPSGTVVLRSLPDIAATEFFYMGGSFTLGPTGGLQSPYSLTLVQSGAPFEEGLRLGPFVQMPQDVDPKLLGVVEQGKISWAQGDPKPDLTLISVYDFPSGCCCLDGNMNGTCEDNEPQMCGPSPFPVNRWSIYAEGGLETYVMPRMLSGLNAFDTPSAYGWFMQEAIAPRFDYHEFIWNQFSPYFWQAWNIWDSAFVTKEEAP